MSDSAEIHRLAKELLDKAQDFTSGHSLILHPSIIMQVDAYAPFNKVWDSIAPQDRAAVGQEAIRLSNKSWNPLVPNVTVLEDGSLEFCAGYWARPAERSTPTADCIVAHPDHRSYIFNNGNVEGTDKHFR